MSGTELQSKLYVNSYFSYLELFNRLTSLDIDWHNELKLSKDTDDQKWSSNIQNAA